MDDSVVKEVVETVAKEHERDYFADFGAKGYTPVRIVDGNFKEIAGKEHTNKIVFIDGGNAEILGGANFSFQLFRFYYGVYAGTERKNSARNEFYSLFTTKEGADGIVFSSKMYDGALLDNMEFDPHDVSLKEGMHRARISKAADVVRRFAELQTAIKICETLGEGDIIVLDGNLEATYSGELAYFDKLYRRAGERNVIVVGISKATSLVTKKGTSVPSLLLGRRPEGAWYYSNVVEIMNESHKADVLFAKLHQQSNFVFRVDIYDGVPYNPDDVFDILYSHSRDPVFLGYPYGLIEADRFARISNQEREMLQMQFKVKAGKDWEKVEQVSRMQGAHEVLDRIG